MEISSPKKRGASDIPKELDFDKLRWKLGLHEEIWKGVTKEEIRYIFELENVAHEENRATILTEFAKKIPGIQGSNPRLVEFFGDTILEMIVTQRLYFMGSRHFYPAKATIIRKVIVSNYYIRTIMESRNICEYVKNDIQKHCSNIFESLLATLYFYAVKNSILDPLGAIDTWLDDVWLFDVRLEIIISAVEEFLKNNGKSPVELVTVPPLNFINMDPMFKGTKNGYIPINIFPVTDDIHKIVNKWINMRNKGNNSKTWREITDNSTEQTWDWAFEAAYSLGIFPVDSVSGAKLLIKRKLNYLERVPDFMIERMSPDLEKLGRDAYIEMLKLIIDSKGIAYIAIIMDIMKFLGFLGLTGMITPSIFMSYSLDYYSGIIRINLMKIWIRHRNKKDKEWTSIKTIPHTNYQWNIALDLGFLQGLIPFSSVVSLTRGSKPLIDDILKIQDLGKLAKSAELMFPEEAFNGPDEFRRRLREIIAMDEVDPSLVPNLLYLFLDTVKLKIPEVSERDFKNPVDLVYLFLEVYQNIPRNWKHPIPIKSVKQSWDIKTE